MHFIRRRNEKIYGVCDKGFVACTFQAQKFRNDGTVTYQGPVFSNLILDVGLDLLATGPYGFTILQDFLNVGTDSTAPAIDQTGLLAYLASSDSVYSSISGYNTNPAYRWRQATIEFAVGSCTGNLTELGLSHSPNTDYFNRQLFKDEAGAPTTITVLSDEGLRVTVTLYFYSNLAPGGSEIGSFLLNGTDTIDVTRELTTNTNWLSQWFYSNIVALTEMGTGMVRLSDSATGFSGTTASSVTPLSYTAGNFYQDWEAIWNAGRFVGDAASLMMDIDNKASEYEFSAFRFNPVIPVTNVEEIKFTIRRAWGRYAA